MLRCNASSINASFYGVTMPPGRNIPAALERVQVRLAYDANTHKLVSIFQEEQGLEASSVVDELTAMR